jgi:hypothetical protein
MDQQGRLSEFAQEFPFPWSIAPGGRVEDTCRSLEAETAQALVNFETFVERFRERLGPSEEMDVPPSSPAPMA